jgi:hypothetical protein
MNILSIIIRNKILFLIIIITLVKLYISVFYYGLQPSQFAPDEIVYAELNKWVLLGGKPADFLLFGGDLFFTSLSFNIPTIGFIALGVPQILAIRLTANLYSLLSILLIYKTFIEIKSDKLKFASNKYFERFMNLLIVIYLLLPSHFIWATLGIRESTNEFWLIFTFYICYQIFKDKNRTINYIYLFLCIQFLYFSRPQIGYLVVFVMICLGLIVILRERRAFLLISVLGSWFTIAILNLLISNIYVNDSKNLIGGIIKQSGKITSPITKQLISPVDSLTKITKIQKARMQDANTAVDVILCPRILPTDSIICKIYQTPKLSINYISRPIFIVDKLETTTQKYAATENLFWILITIYVFVLSIMTIKYINQNFYFKIGLLLYIILFIVLSGLYEGNYGTAFRHKSLLLPIFLILIMILQIDLAQQRTTKKLKKYLQ